MTEAEHPQDGQAPEPLVPELGASPDPDAPVPADPRDAAPELGAAPDPETTVPPGPRDAEAGAPPFPVPEEVADLSPEELSPALAAVCFALNRPVSLGEVAAILGRSQTDAGAAAEHLAASLRGGGLMLQRHQDELQLVTRPEVAWAVQRALNPEKPGRLSRAALETLAIVAYRQPLTRAAVEAIRGVNCEAVLDSLERRALIVEVGRQDSPGHPRLFGTTLRFLQVVGLERIEDLPPLPEGLAVPELPVAGWEVEPEPAALEPEPALDPEPAEEEPEGIVEVRGEPINADPDEGYGPDGDEPGAADELPPGDEPGNDPGEPGAEPPPPGDEP